MKLFGIFIVTCLVCVLNAHPSPLQGFSSGGQTTGSKWPPYENAGKDYWSLQAANIDLGEHSIDDGKDIVKKGVEKDQPKEISEQEEVEPQEEPAVPTFQNYPLYPTNRQLYTFFNNRRFFLRNPYAQVIF